VVFCLFGVFLGVEGALFLDPAIVDEAKSNTRMIWEVDEADQ
jgi:hypothetical protein